MVGSTIGCGSCSYCRAGYYSQCDIANPNGETAGTAFFGGPETTGSFDGLQAQYARMPFANVNLVKIPGPDRVIGAVGVDAERPKTGPAATDENDEQFAAERAANTPEPNQQGQLWKPGDAPSQAAQWYVQAIAKAGTIGLIGVYPPTTTSFPIGAAMNKNLIIKMGNAEHRRYILHLLNLVASGVVDPSTVLTQARGLDVSALEAYERFDQREEGRIKTVLEPTR